MAEGTFTLTGILKVLDWTYERAIDGVPRAKIKPITPRINSRRTKGQDCR